MPLMHAVKVADGDGGTAFGFAQLAMTKDAHALASLPLRPGGKISRPAAEW
jgi:hypothetical protein